MEPCIYELEKESSQYDKTDVGPQFNIIVSVNLSLIFLHSFDKLADDLYTVLSNLRYKMHLSM